MAEKIQLRSRDARLPDGDAEPAPRPARAPGKQTRSGEHAGFEASPLASRQESSRSSAPRSPGRARRAGDSAPAARERADDWELSPQLLAALGLTDLERSDDDERAPPRRLARGSSPRIATPPSLAAAAAVQAKGALSDQLDGDDISATAAHGVASASSSLPHLDVIQRAFGRHDISRIRAQIGGAAATAAQRLGAHAYATGDRIAFAQSPDLHTAAHEAAHVIQQAGGVQLADGLGRAGDVYEQHADAVADAVVAGRSAEPLLDRFAPSPASSPPSATASRAVQRGGSKYKTAAELKELPLIKLHNHARAQADWAIAPGLDGDKEPLRAILAFARAQNGLVLSSCGNIFVRQLLAAQIGQGGEADLDLLTYCRAASAKNTTTLRIQVPAKGLKQRIAWGVAIRKLEAAFGEAFIRDAIPQRAGGEVLEALVEEGAVDDLITYAATAPRPLLQSKNGKDIVSFIELRKHGGFTNLATYRATLPEIRSHHCFSVAQLDQLVINRNLATNNAAQPTPLPICVVLQTPMDTAGVFQHNPHLTPVLSRDTHITLVAEGKATLAEFTVELTKFASFGEAGQVDEILLAGHGSPKTIKLGGTKKGQADQQGTIADKNRPSDLKAAIDGKTYKDTSTFIIAAAKLLRNTPQSRLVLMACLTAASNIEELALDQNQKVAADQIKTAIQKTPSMAATVKKIMGNHKGELVAANGSFPPGEIELLDSAGKLSLFQRDDAALTDPSKLKYVQLGTNPHGVMLAVLECWAFDPQATLKAIQARLFDDGNPAWRPTVIRAVMRLITGAKGAVTLGHLQSLISVADVLGHLTTQNKCRVSALKAKLPADAQKAQKLLSDLTTSVEWKDEGYFYIPLVVLQAWMGLDPSKGKGLLALLDASDYTIQDVDAFLDLEHLKGSLGDLLPVPTAQKKPPRGALLLALLYLVREGEGAPLAARRFIKHLIGKEQRDFPEGWGVTRLLCGANREEVLEAAGVIQANPMKQKRTPEPNVAPIGKGDNQIHVTSLTKRAVAPIPISAYMLPTGTWLGVIPANLELHVIGKTGWTAPAEEPSDEPEPKRRAISTPNGPTSQPVVGDTPPTLLAAPGHAVDVLAVECTFGDYKTVFIKAADVRLL